MKKIIFRTFYEIEFWWVVFGGILIGATTIIISQPWVFIFLFSAFAIVFWFFSIRRFTFFEDLVVINFLYKKDIIPFKDLKKIVFINPHGAGTKGPFIRIETIYKATLLKKIFLNTFEIGEIEVLPLLKYLKKNRIEIEIKSTKNEYKINLMREISED